ncbi:MAG: hypothetical protein CL608_17480 [Anaerolineaceae bacterium]|nr:hypothetical protein [Anaerolineaceae bacterium]
MKTKLKANVAIAGKDSAQINRKGRLNQEITQFDVGKAGFYKIIVNVNQFLITRSVNRRENFGFID